MIPQAARGSDPAIRYQASRNRGTRTAKLRGTLQDSEIMQLMGWSTTGMIGRYAGEIPIEQIARKLGATSGPVAPLRSRVS